MQKRFNKFINTIITLTLCCSLAACGNGNNASDTQKEQETETQNTASSVNDDKSLYDHGMDVVALMEEMVQSDYYIDIMAGSTEIKAMVDNIAQGDYTSPKAVYSVSVPSFDKLLALLDEDFSRMSELSEELQAQLNNRSSSTFINQINARAGMVELATTSSLIAGKLFVSDTPVENVFYLYTFESGYPIAIVFQQGEDGATSASGSFLLSEILSTETADDIEEFFRDIYMTCTVEEIEK